MPTDPISVLWYPELAAELARQDLTRIDLATAVGCHAGTISQILRGRLAPSVELRHRIAEHLNVDEATLFDLHPRLAGLVPTDRRADANSVVAHVTGHPHAENADTEAR